MAPIRTAIIGLSSSAATSWASAAHLPYLLSPRGLERFRIVALCNSSVEAAQAAIKHYGLPSDTKAYGDPEALAADQNVELVVCNTRVDRHYETIYPSVKAGKAVFSEWPLAHNVAKVRELVELAKTSGSKTAVGTQGRLLPLALTIRDVISEGRIGQVLSSEARAAGGSVDRTTLSKGIAYFTQREIGGNVFTIGFGHRKLSRWGFPP